MKKKEIITNPTLNIKNIVVLNFDYFIWYIVNNSVAKASVQSRTGKQENCLIQVSGSPSNLELIVESKITDVYLRH